uniref:Uncharacterized protein n=1 Tax=Opuntia streptacantha TaxID=393608 RepID=A0A7C8YVC1_OPUST
MPQNRPCSVFLLCSARFGPPVGRHVQTNGHHGQATPLGAPSHAASEPVRPPPTLLRLTAFPLFVFSMKALLEPVLCAAARKPTFSATTVTVAGHGCPTIATTSDLHLPDFWRLNE